MTMPDQKLPLAKMEEVQADEDAGITGQIKVITYVDSWPSHTAWVRENKIAAIIALKESGPTRLLFIGGGHIDICGGAEIWRRHIRIAELRSSRERADVT